MIGIHAVLIETTRSPLVYPVWYFPRIKDALASTYVSTLSCIHICRSLPTKFAILLQTPLYEVTVCLVTN